MNEPADPTLCPDHFLSEQVVSLLPGLPAYDEETEFDPFYNLPLWGEVLNLPVVREREPPFIGYVGDPLLIGRSGLKHIPVPDETESGLQHRQDELVRIEIFVYVEDNAAEVELGHYAARLDTS